MKEDSSRRGLTFRPAIKHMVSEHSLVKEHLNAEQIRALTPEITIPQDTSQSRLMFKSVPGMN